MIVIHNLNKDLLFKKFNLLVKSKNKYNLTKTTSHIVNSYRSAVVTKFNQNLKLWTQTDPITKLLQIQKNK
jgi:predicted transcriptional regulator